MKAAVEMKHHPPLRSIEQKAKKNKPANIICDEEVLKKFPYFNRKVKVNETDKIKRQEAIIYKTVKQIPSDNDKWLC